MRILRHKIFKRRYKRLDKFSRKRVDSSIEKLYRDPFDPSLRNHALSGKMHGKRSISVTGDIRIIFEEHGDYVLVVMLDVGTHGQVYG